MPLFLKLAYSRKLGPAVFCIPRSRCKRTMLGLIGLLGGGAFLFLGIAAFATGILPTRDGHIQVHGPILWLCASALLSLSLVIFLVLPFTMNEAIVHERGLELERREAYWSEIVSVRWNQFDKDVLIIKFTEGDPIDFRVPNKFREPLLKLLEQNKGPTTSGKNGS